MNNFPPRCWRLLQPLDGVKTMLELGNKVTCHFEWKAAFEAMGIRHTSVDWNGKNRALVLDLRKPLGLGQFDAVTNFGTTEHVSEQEPVWRNIHEALKVGGLLVSETPMPGYWPGHGDFYPTFEFYREFADKNGYQVERLYRDDEPLYSVDEPLRPVLSLRARKLLDAAFIMPAAPMFRDPG